MAFQIIPPAFCYTGYLSGMVQLRQGFRVDDFQHLDAPTFLPSGAMVKAYGWKITGATNGLAQTEGEA